MKITDEGRKVCEAINLSITQGEMLIYNQGIVDGLKTFKQMMTENPNLTTDEFIQVIDIFINDHTKDGMATEDTFVAPPEEEKNEEENTEVSEETPSDTEEAPSEDGGTVEGEVVNSEPTEGDKAEMADAMGKISEALAGNPLGALFGSMLSSSAEDLANSVKEQLAES